MIISLANDEFLRDIFLTYFAADYISINPNLVKYTIVEKLKKL